MLRKDGAILIYKIQHLARNGSWTDSSLDHFGHPEGFNASGDCWQKTGHHGALTEEIAKAGLRWLRDRHPERKFRVVRVFLEQSSIPMEW